MAFITIGLDLRLGGKLFPLPIGFPSKIVSKRHARHHRHGDGIEMREKGHIKDFFQKLGHDALDSGRGNLFLSLILPFLVFIGDLAGLITFEEENLPNPLSGIDLGRN